MKDTKFWLIASATLVFGILLILKYFKTEEPKDNEFYVIGSNHNNGSYNYGYNNYNNSYSNLQVRPISEAPQEGSVHKKDAFGNEYSIRDSGSYEQVVTLYNIKAKDGKFTMPDTLANGLHINQVHLNKGLKEFSVGERKEENDEDYYNRLRIIGFDSDVEILNLDENCTLYGEFINIKKISGLYLNRETMEHLEKLND